MAGGFDYRRMVHEASISVVRRVLTSVAEDGLPGSHHLFVTFATAHPEAQLSPALRSQFPETMTIVLQHQYWDLAVEATAFEVTLRFGPARERLRVPFSAITTFIDPSVPFGLDLSPFGGGAMEGAPAAAEGGAQSDPPPASPPRPDGAAASEEPPEAPPEAPGRGEVLPFRRR